MTRQPVWWALWNEGLATYVSWKLNPTLTAPEIFWIPRDMEAQMQPKLAEAARLMLVDLDGHEGYRRWFVGGSNPPGPAVAQRLLPRLPDGEAARPRRPRRAGAHAAEAGRGRGAEVSGGCW